MAADRRHLTDAVDRLTAALDVLAAAELVAETASRQLVDQLAARRRNRGDNSRAR